MFEINKDIIFVKGFTNGAIYNFNDNKVYSVNKSACIFSTMLCFCASAVA